MVRGVALLRRRPARAWRFAVLALAGAAAGCATARTGTTRTATTGTDTTRSDAARTATVLYVTDAHEIAPVADRHGDRGGVARLKTVVSGIERRAPEALLVFGGDLAGGTLFGGVFHGEPMVEALGKAGVDLASFGQHDFDFGSSHTRKLVSSSAFPWITSNLVDQAGAPFAGLPTRVVRRVGDLRVGFLGLTADMHTTTRDGTVVEKDLLESARREVAALRREGAEAVVALTQAGLPVNERLLRDVPEIDAVLTEERSESVSVVGFVGARPIASPCGNLGSVVELRLVKDGARAVRAEVLAHPVDASSAPDPDLHAMERRYMALLDERLAGRVAELAEPLLARRGAETEVPLASLVADAFREATGADAALVAVTSMRADLPAGTLTRRHVAAVLPFGNRVALVELSGAEVRALLEKSLSDAMRADAPLHVSGLAYEADATRPDGSRLVRVLHGDTPLDDAKAYRVALSSYLAAGGEGYADLAKARRLAPEGGEPLDADALAAHLARLVERGPVPPPSAGRVVVRGR